MNQSSKLTTPLWFYSRFLFIGRKNHSSHCLTSGHQVFRKIDRASLWAMIWRPRPSPAPCSLGVSAPAPGKAGWVAPTSIRGESAHVPEHVFSLGFVRRLEAVLPKPSQVDRRRGLFLSPSVLFFLTFRAKAAQHHECCGHLKKLLGKMKKKKKWKHQKEKESSYTSARLPPAASLLPSCPPSTGRPPSFTFSHMLQKSETVIKAISNVYSGDVQYKAETWYLLLTDK